MPGSALRWEDGLPQRAGQLRLAMRFTAADTPPRVTVVSNTLSAAAEARALERVAGYRVPCLSPAVAAQGVEMMQEFRAGDPSGTVERPVRLIQAMLPQNACLQQPPATEVLQRLERLPPQFFAKVMIQSRFTGGPNDAPQNSLVFSSAPPRVNQALLARADEIRMACRKPGDRPQTLRQAFTFEVGAVKHEGAPGSVSLDALMALMRADGAAAVEFNFGSMRCPFDIEWRSLKPAAPNEARAAGRADLDRAEFLAWLASLRLAAGADKESDWFGERIRVQIPCGIHSLKPGVGAVAVR
jgi:hypothetical protein